VGLEAALYARCLGYEVDVYEQDQVGAHLLRWGHVRMFTPFGLNRSPLGLAALAAQDPHWRPPADDALLTGRDLVAAYLAPLSRSDLLIDGLHEQTEVLAVGRQDLLKGEAVGDDRRADGPFRLLLNDRRAGAGVASTSVATADVVIDATGTFGQPNALGRGGLPAPGEIELRDAIEYGLPDVLGNDRAVYAGRRVLVVGAGFSAATTVVALARLAESVPGGQVFWLARRPATPGQGPVRTVAPDRLPARHALAQEANALAAASGGAVQYLAGGWVESLAAAVGGGCDVCIAGDQSAVLRVDRIVANVGYRPNARLYQELQVHECYATGGPMKLAARLLERSGGDCLDERACGPESLLHPEPDFYILGAKSYGRSPQFLLAVGLAQIRELFTVLGDRADLDLYAGVQHLCP
jgi:hypothetical protein